MYATIRRRELSAGSTDDLAEASAQLGVILMRVSGFVATLAVEDRCGDLITVSLFEDRGSLITAESLTDGWAAQHCDRLRASATELAVGEVVAQRGL